MSCSAITLASTPVPARESGQPSPKRERAKWKGRAKRFGSRGEMGLSLSVTLYQSMTDNMLMFTQLKRARAVRLHMSDAVPLPCPDTPLQKKFRMCSSHKVGPPNFLCSHPHDDFCLRQCEYHSNQVSEETITLHAIHPSLST